jgi:hypothetical protein
MECYPFKLFSLDIKNVSKTSIRKGKPKIKKGMVINNEKKIKWFSFLKF